MGSWKLVVVLQGGLQCARCCWSKVVADVVREGAAMLHDVSGTVSYVRPVCQPVVNRLQVLLPVSTLRQFLSSSAPAVVVFQSVECSWLSQHILCRQLSYNHSSTTWTSTSKSVSRTSLSLSCRAQISHVVRCYVFPMSYGAEELSAGRPTCSTCNVVHCNTKSTVNQPSTSSREHHPASVDPASSTAAPSHP